MKIKGVITGDIIQSTRIKPENKQLVLDTIRNTVYEMEKWSKMKLEILSFPTHLHLLFHLSLIHI